MRNTRLVGYPVCGLIMRYIQKSLNVIPAGACPGVPVSGAGSQSFQSVLDPGWGLPRRWRSRGDGIR